MSALQSGRRRPLSVVLLAAVIVTSIALIPWRDLALLLRPAPPQKAPVGVTFDALACGRAEGHVGLGAILVQELNQEAIKVGSPLVVRPLEDSHRVLEELLSGQVSLGLVDARELAWSRRREPGRFDAIRAIANVTVQVATLVATRRSGVQSVQGLDGRKVGVSRESHVDVLVLADILAAAGLKVRYEVLGGAPPSYPLPEATAKQTPDAIPGARRAAASGVTVVLAPPEQLRAALGAHRLEAVFTFVDHPSLAVRRLTGTASLRLLPLPIDMNELWGRFAGYQRAPVPAAIYPRFQQAGELQSVGAGLLLVTGTAIQDAQVDRTVKGLLEAIPRLQVWPRLSGVTDITLSSPLHPEFVHPAAQQVYDRALLDRRGRQGGPSGEASGDDPPTPTPEPPTPTPAPPTPAPQVRPPVKKGRAPRVVVAPTPAPPPPPSPTPAPPTPSPTPAPPPGPSVTVVIASADAADDSFLAATGLSSVVNAGFDAHRYRASSNLPRLSVLPTPTFDSSLLAVLRGDAQLALVRGDVLDRATTGALPLEGASLDQLQIVGRVYSSALTVVARLGAANVDGKVDVDLPGVWTDMARELVRLRSRVESSAEHRVDPAELQLRRDLLLDVTDLEGLRVSIRKDGSSLPRTNSITLFEPKRFLSLLWLEALTSMERPPNIAAELFNQERIDAFVFSAAHPSPWLASWIPMQQHVRLVPVGGLTHELAKLRYVNQVEIDASRYPGQEGAMSRVSTVGIPVFLVVRKDTPTEVVEPVVDVLLRQGEGLGVWAPMLGQPSAWTLSEALYLSLHPAAARAYTMAQTASSRAD